MQKKWRVSALAHLIVLAVILGGCQYHRGGFFTPEERVKQVIDKVERELNLDAAQKTQLQQIAQEIREKVLATAAQRKSDHQKLIALIRQEQISPAEMTTLMQEHRERWQTLGDFIAQRFVDFHASLTPEQRDKLADIMAKQFERHCNSE